MSRTVYTFNRFNIGDNLIFLHLLRSLAKAHADTPFVHFCGAHLHSQLVEVVQDLPNILLEPFESPLWAEHQNEAECTWKNFRGFWEASPFRWDWSRFTLSHHDWTANRMGFPSPFTCREHLLFDYPALEPQGDEPEADFLIGDSAPSSGQYSEWADHSKQPLVGLIYALHKAGKKFYQTTGFARGGGTISEVGRCSLKSKHHIMVPNGPFWPTLNTTNHHFHEGRRRIVLMDNGENLNMPHIQQVPNVEAVMQIAKQEGWI